MGHTFDMAQRLCLLDGRPGAVRRRGTGPTRSTKEVDGEHRSHNHAADRAAGPAGPADAAVARARCAPAPRPGDGPEGRAWGRPKRDKARRPKPDALSHKEGGGRTPPS